MKLQTLVEREAPALRIALVLTLTPALLLGWLILWLVGP